MARISTYDQDTNVSFQDKLIGTNSVDSSTKNFTLQSVIDLINQLSGVNLFDGMVYKFQSYLPAATDPVGILNLVAGNTSTTAFSAVTQIIVSKKVFNGLDVAQYLSSLNGKRFKITKQDDLNTFAVYRVTSVADFTNNRYLRFVVTFVRGNGSFVPNSFYFLTFQEPSFVVDFDDVTSAGSGQIITNTERTTLGTSLQPTDITDNVTSTDTNKALSANQGKILNDAITAINTLLTLNPPNAALDELQEIVAYIQTNRATLNTLGISNITGLQTALNAKVDVVTGKALSENDFTNALLAKLNGIASGAQVNVKSNWNEQNALADSFIEGKPTDITDLSTHNITELSDVNTAFFTGSTATSLTDAGSGSIITSAERTKLTGIDVDPANNTITDGTDSITVAPSSRTIQVLGTTNEVEVSPTGAQPLTANRIFTVGLPNDVTIGNDLTVTGDATASSFVKSGGTAAQILLADGTVIDLTIESQGINNNDVDTKIPSNAAVKDAIDTAITNLIDNSPTALDTLNELAAAIGDDANFSTTITTALGNRLQFDQYQALTSTQVTQVLNNLLITSTVQEINFLDGVTSTLAYKSHTVTVGSKTGGGNAYYIDGKEAPRLVVLPGTKYRFDLSSNTLSSHPFKFSENENGTGTGTYTANATYSGTPGNASAYAEITGHYQYPVLYYYCTQHAGMGNIIKSTISLEGFSIGDFSDVDLTNNANNKILKWDQSSGKFVSADESGGTVTETFKTIAVTGTAGQSDVVADSATDTVTFNAGTGMSITTNASNDTIEFSSTATGGTDLNTLNTAAVDVASDSIGFIDSSDSNNSKKSTIANLVSQIAGSNLTASNGQLNAQAGSSGGTVTVEKNVHAGDGTTTAFATTTAIANENNVQVYIDGVYQSKNNYTTSGSTVTFSPTAPANGTSVELIHMVESSGVIARDTFTGDNTTTAFTLSMSISNENATQVYIDGVYQSKDNYTTSGSVLTFTSTAPATGTSIEVIHIKAVNASSINQNNFTGNGSQTFTLSQSIDDEAKTFVFIQGVYQEKSTYNISGNQITFNTAPQTGFTVEVMAFDSITIGNQASGGIDWQSTPKVASFTASAGEGYFINTTSGGITLTLPSSPSSGDEVSVVDYAGTFDSNFVTLTSSNNINGSSDDLRLGLERSGVSLVYSDATQGWLAYNAVNEGSQILAPLDYDITYLVVGGGGGGAGFGQAGGGGGGGFLPGTLTGSSLTSGTALNISIGAGGAGGPGGTQGANSKGTNGGASTLSGTGITTISAAGGGYGHGHQYNGGDGGSGGGSGTNSGSGGVGGSGNTPSTTPSQGNAGGGSGSYSTPYSGGGGGGAGGAGTDGGGQAGNGGIGATTTIISTANAQNAAVGEVSGGAVYFSGGGGGGGYESPSGTGGLGGGGDATPGPGGSGQNASSPNNTTANTGGGGPGSGGWHSGNTGGAGSSGVVILRMPLGSFSGTTTGSPLQYTEGNFKVLVFKQQGSYTI